MIIKATQLSTRQAPRKVRLVANSVKKLSLEDAVRQLSVINRRASIVVLKVLRQAIANATHNHGLSIADLKIKTIQVDEGARYRRFRAVSRGRAHGIIKRTSHITVELETQSVATPAVKPAAKSAEQAPAVKAESSKKTEKKTETKKAPAKKAATKKPAAKKTTKKAAKAKSTEKK